MQTPASKPSVIYLKTPKTAGTSLMEVLTDTRGEPAVVSGKTRRWPAESQLAEARLIVLGDVIIKRFRRQYPAVWDKAVKVAAVRNPYTKTLSAWRYCQSTKHLSLEDALGKQMPRKRWYERYSHDYVHFTPSQSSFLVDDDGLLADYLIRFESLQDDFNVFLQAIGEAPVELPRRNPTQRPADPTSDLSSAAVDRINELYACDFEAFGYEMLPTANREPVAS